jgi:PAS domain S-box-containing protein
MLPKDLGIGGLFDDVRDAVVAADPRTGRIVLWNEAATEIFGYSPSEALELDIAVLFPESLRAAQRRAVLDHHRNTGHGPRASTRKLRWICRRCARVAERSASR